MTPSDKLREIAEHWMPMVRYKDKGKDVIENLMALCRDHHDACHNKKNTYLHPGVMQAIHDNFLKSINKN